MVGVLLKELDILCCGKRESEKALQNREGPVLVYRGKLREKNQTNCTSVAPTGEEGETHSGPGPRG